MKADHRTFDSYLGTNYGSFKDEKTNLMIENYDEVVNRPVSLISPLCLEVSKM